MASFEPGEIIVLSSGEDSNDVSSPVSKVVKIECRSDCDLSAQ